MKALTERQKELLLVLMRLHQNHPDQVWFNLEEIGKRSDRQPLHELVGYGMVQSREGTKLNGSPQMQYRLVDPHTVPGLLRRFVYGKP